MQFTPAQLELIWRVQRQFRAVSKQAEAAQELHNTSLREAMRDPAAGLSRAARRARLRTRGGGGGGEGGGGGGGVGSVALLWCGCRHACFPLIYSLKR